MILNLDVSNNSFTKLLALIHDAEDSLDEELNLCDSHRISFRIYTIISKNDKNEFNQSISNYLSRLNSLALSNPYDNQSTLLLIDAFHNITTDCHYYNDLKELFSDIRFIYIPEFRWEDYREQPTQPEQNSGQEISSSVESNDFDFDDNILSKDFSDEETKIGDTQLIDDFDFGDDFVKPIGKRPIPINKKKEFKPWVIPLFAFAGLVLFGSLLYGYFN